MNFDMIEFVASAEHNSMKVEYSKFGGSSFVPAMNTNAMADYICDAVAGGHKQVIFCSAPGDLTESLKELADDIQPGAHSAAIDGLVTCSDLVGAYLLQHAMIQANVSSKLLTGLNNGIETNDIVGGAQIKQVIAIELHRHLEDVDVVILPGGQGASSEGLRWLGKNSSDLSCILHAIAAEQSYCTIHSDVDSVFNADPNVLSEAQPYTHLDYDTVITAASLGAKVLHHNAVRLAKKHELEIVCKLNRPPFDTGTRIGHFKAGKIIVTDKMAQLISSNTRDLPLIQKFLIDSNVLSFSKGELKQLGDNELLIPMSYINYFDMAQSALPHCEMTMQKVVAIHVVSGTEVLESQFCEESELVSNVTLLHSQYILESEVAYV